MKSVEQYKVFSVELEGTAEGNPYVDVTFGARFERADGGDAVDVPGFYKGDGTYGVNFMPGSAGAWNTPRIPATPPSTEYRARSR